MGIEWEAYHKGVPLLGVPENPILRRGFNPEGPTWMSRWKLGSKVRING